ncbi:MAG TPA: hypothetical protein VFS23_16060 [Vicinamibacterales bacterium]|nr:hypothetical protein [Vicinamibacterales bacterium]
MRPKDRTVIADIDAHLGSYAREVRPLPGIQAEDARLAFLEQVAESLHRVAYARTVARRPVHASRIDPSSSMFDPVRGAIFRMRQNEIDEAFWLVFIFVHFGKHRRDGYQLARDIYGRLGEQPPWTWQEVSRDPQAFRAWLHSQQATLKHDGVRRRFGNHRKYESLDAWSTSGTGEAVETYVTWVRPFGTHARLVADVQARVGADPKLLFHGLYESMGAVARFGRTARFDYLAMVGKLGLATIEPDSTYMTGSSGPVSGARLLFAGNAKAQLPAGDLDRWLVDLDGRVGVGMQVLEDALCNWQKSPNEFKAFRG